ncbi:hypothetical protein EMIT0194P_50332 [Pseudomonas serbica]
MRKISNNLNEASETRIAGSSHVQVNYSVIKNGMKTFSDLSHLTARSTHLVCCLTSPAMESCNV